MSPFVAALTVFKYGIISRVKAVFVKFAFQDFVNRINFSSNELLYC